MDKIENQFLAVLRLPVKISPVILNICISLHIICLFLPWLSALDVGLKIILTSVPIVSFCWYLFKIYFYEVDQRVNELILDSKDRWQVRMKNDAVHHAKLGQSFFVHPWLTIINLEFEGVRRYFIFTSEILDETIFRRLRVRLRFHIQTDGH